MPRPAQSGSNGGASTLVGAAGRPYTGWVARLLAPLAVLTLLAGCASRAERLDYYGHASGAMNGAWMSYAVWAPRDLHPDERLPLVVFLHGAGGSEGTFDQRGMSARLDRALAEGRVPRAIVLLPDGGFGMWANWHDRTRRYEDWVVDELVPIVRERYHTAACPEHCHVVGVSMGGSGALRFALHRPDRFSTVAAISAPIFDAEAYQDFATDRLYAIFIPSHRIFGPITRAKLQREDPYLRWTEPADTGMRHVFLAWAEGDRPFITDTMRQFHQHLDAHGIEHTVVAGYPGDHNWQSWSPIVEQAIREAVASE